MAESKDLKHGQDSFTKAIEGTMSDLRQRGEVVEIITCGDFHFSHEAPIIRRSEPDWYNAMRRPLIELRKLKEVFPQAVLIYSGDIFDNGWKENKVPPQLINFLIDNLPRGYGIPGQHDLPHHRLEDIKKSAFWTLVKTGKIDYLSPSIAYPDRNLLLWGFPWGVEVKPLIKPLINCLNVAVIHAYCWTSGSSYPNAPEEGHANYWSKLLQGFDVAIFGDNHKRFVHSPVGRCYIRNNGKFMTRKVDEMDQPPTVGLMTNKKNWYEYTFNQTLNHYNLEHLIDKKEGEEIDAEQVIEGLLELGEKNYDFYETMRRVAIKQNEEVKDVILRALRRTGGK